MSRDMRAGLDRFSAGVGVAAPGWAAERSPSASVRSLQSRADGTEAVSEEVIETSGDQLSGARGADGNHEGRYTALGERSLETPAPLSTGAHRDAGEGSAVGVQAPPENPRPTPEATQQGAATTRKPQGWPAGNVAEPRDIPADRRRDVEPSPASPCAPTSLDGVLTATRRYAESNARLAAAKQRLRATPEYRQLEVEKRKNAGFKSGLMKAYRKANGGTK